VKTPHLISDQKFLVMDGWGCGSTGSVMTYFSDVNQKLCCSANVLVEYIFHCSDIVLDISEILCTEFNVVDFVRLQITSTFEFLSFYLLIYRFLIILVTHMLLLKW
jgi:hypothetical protein